ncbi:MAG: MFS transporter [Planctomycetota bacterium]|nr:MFS transporter [Planctomycetota bacterium]
MTPIMYARLSAMVFLHYFVWSCWYVTMGTYLTEKRIFSGEEVGLAYGTIAIGAMISPFFIGIVADRFFASERLLSLLHLSGAALLYWISTIHSFGLFYPVLIVYATSYMAGHALTSTITLHHVTDPAKNFPHVMLMGSVGWIAAGLINSALDLGSSAGMFRLAALAALVTGIYSLTLPYTPPKGKGAPISPRVLLGLDALKLMRDRSFATFIVCSLLICIPLSFYFTWIGFFMTELNFSNVASKLTIGQVSDVVFLLMLPVLLPILTVKGILLVGIAAWAVRFLLFAWFYQQQDQSWMLYLGIAVHGMCYDFIFVMGRMYVDRWASIDIRGAAQGLHTFVTLGLGMFIGTWLAGIVGQYYSYKVGKETLYHWDSIWMVPVVMAVVLFVAFAVLFKNSIPPSEREGAAG